MKEKDSKEKKVMERERLKLEWKKREWYIERDNGKEEEKMERKDKAKW